MNEVYKSDCRHFKGDIPCVYHKKEGVHCSDCPHYDRVEQRILIIKLGAAGDVIRTTPLLRKLKEVYPKAELYWLTRFPELVPNLVDHILPFQLESILILQATHFNYLFNLDKEKEACALAKLISAEVKKGFTLKGGKCSPIDQDAEEKFLTGLFDDYNKAKAKSYPQEIFEICGFRFSGERYILDNFESENFHWQIPEPRPLVGLNTGCGGRWRSRLWPEENWIELARRLKREGFGVLILGGEAEHQKNLRISRRSGATYLGHFPLKQFINLVDQCDLVVTAVTMATHIAIGLGKRIVLFNNVFNKNEFELYGLGEILEPEFQCDCFYSPECPNNCMQYIYPQRVFEVCCKLLGYEKGGQPSR